MCGSGLRVAWRGFLSDARQLAKAPVELRWSLLLKCLTSYAYVAIVLNMTPFLSDELGMSDVAAGWVYGMFGLLTSVYGFLCGGVIDRLGVRKSLLVGGWMSLVGRAMFAFAPKRFPALVYLSTLVFAPMGEAFAMPILIIAVKRYTSERTRSFGFGVFYTFINLGGLLGGRLTDVLRDAFSDGAVIRGTHLSALRLVFSTSVLASLAYLLVAHLCFREIEVDASGAVQEFQPTATSLTSTMRKSCRDPSFWRLMVVSTLLTFAKMLFTHMDATFPKYVVREHGPDAPYGSIYAINPLSVILLVPVAASLTASANTFNMLVLGSIISGASPFILLLGSSYTNLVVFVFIFSVGEVIYSPRTYEYTMALSPKGREGLYSSIASAPMFIARVGVGSLSGVLLQDHCPAQPPRHCERMWFIIGVMSAAPSIVLCLLKPWIDVPSPVVAHDSERPAHGEGVGDAEGDSDSVTPPQSKIYVEEDEALCYGLMDGGDEAPSSADVSEDDHPASSLLRRHAGPACQR